MTNQWKPSTGVPTGGQSPIRRVNWNLVAWSPEERTYGQGTETARTGMVIKCQFKVNRIIEAIEPYTMPICELVIPYTDPSKSQGGTRWEALSKSGRDNIGLVQGRPWELDDLVGKDQEWAQLSAPLRQALTEDDGTTPKMDGNGRQLWGDVQNLCWQIVSVEGLSPTGANGNGAQVGSAEDILDYIARTAEGLDADSLHIKLVTDPRVVGNSTIISQITNRQLVTNLITLGKLRYQGDGVTLTAVEA